jgi:phosphoglycerol transferase MdoB-like AlkP superfamily enzyme
LFYTDFFGISHGKGARILKKRVKKEKIPPRHQWGILPSLLLAVLMTGVSTLLCLWVQPNRLRDVLVVFYHQPLLIILNCLPIGALIVAFSIWFRNVFSGTRLVGTCCAFLSLANRIKLVVRDEPLVPRDFTLLKEAANATGEYHINWPWTTIAVIIVFCFLMKFCARFVGIRRYPILEKKRNRLIGCLSCIGILTVLIFTLFASTPLYNSFTVSNPYYIPTVFNELGFPYCFSHSFTTYTVDKPDGFRKSQAVKWDAGEKADKTSKKKKVNVIMIQNEAFSDLTDNDVFTYSEKEDPLKNLHAVQKSAHCISGHIVVPGFAGGTANTEFDVLTGMQTNALSATTTSAFRAVNRNLDSLFRVYNADGYTTTFMHPGFDWFYNRENVYQWLGAQKIQFADDMKNAKTKGTWVTDDYMASQIEKQFEDTTAAGKNLFNMTVTIQNHMSYTADKYGDGYQFPPVQTSASLTDDAKTMLSVYIEGVRDADAMLGRLTTYFSKSDEPVVLVFWGDHLPYLGDNQLCYRELGLDAGKAEKQRTDPLSSYKTPYVLWSNDAAAKQLNWDKRAAALKLDKSHTISACYLGATTLEMTGRGEESPWFHYLTEVRQSLPVIQKKLCLTEDDQVTGLTTLPEKQQKLISKLRCWSYYKLRYKHIA